MDEDSVVAHRMRSLARLTRPVIHEARGASSAIGIHAELLATTIEDTPDADLQLRQRRYLDVLQDEHRRLQRVFESFVGYATVPDTGPSAFNLADLVRDVTVLARAYAAEHHVTLVAEDAARDLPAHGRRALLQQALLDLLLDVVDRCGRGQRVGLAVEEQHGKASVVVSAPDVLPLAESEAGWRASFDQAEAVLHASGSTLRVEVPEPPRARCQNA